MKIWYSFEYRSILLSAMYIPELLKSKATKKLYKAAKDYVERLLENELIEGAKYFATKAIDNESKALLKAWKDYLVPKVQEILRLIVSRDPVSC